MFSDKSPEAELKLIDFGLSKVFLSFHFSPRFLHLTNTPTVWWGLGTISHRRYMQMSFEGGDTRNHVTCGLLELSPIFYWLDETLFLLKLALDPPISPKRYHSRGNTGTAFLQKPSNSWKDCFNLIQWSVLQVWNQESCYVAAQAQESPWLRRQYPAVPPKFSPSLVQNMQAFQSFNRLKKAAMTAVAYHLNNVWNNRGNEV